MKAAENNRLCVEISADTLKRLLSANQLCAADLNCLDCVSKQCLRRLCLESCSGNNRLDAARPAPCSVVRLPGASAAVTGKQVFRSKIRLVSCPAHADLWKERA